MTPHQGIEPRSAVLETAMLATKPVRQLGATLIPENRFQLQFNLTRHPTERAGFEPAPRDYRVTT